MTKKKKTKEKRKINKNKKKRKKERKKERNQLTVVPNVVQTFISLSVCSKLALKNKIK